MTRAHHSLLRSRLVVTLGNEIRRRKVEEFMRSNAGHCRHLTRVNGSLRRSLEGNREETGSPIKRSADDRGTLPVQNMPPRYVSRFGG